jgi:hypothetical protein
MQTPPAPDIKAPMLAVQYVASGAAHITMNRPAVFSACDEHMIAELGASVRCMREAAAGFAAFLAKRPPAWAPKVAAPKVPAPQA